MVISKSFFKTYFEMNIDRETDTILTISRWYLLIDRIDTVFPKNDNDELKNS